MANWNSGVTLRPAADSSGFGENGSAALTAVTGEYNFLTAVAVKSGNSIVVAAYGSDCGYVLTHVTRGAVDGSFGSGGTVQLSFYPQALAIQDGNILVAGTGYDASGPEPVVACYSGDGSTCEWTACGNAGASFRRPGRAIRGNRRAGGERTAFAATQYCSASRPAAGTTFGAAATWATFA